MTTHAQINETLKLAGIRNPATLNSTPATTNAVDFSKFSKVIGVLVLGDMANETVDFRLESSATDVDFGGTVTTRVAATQLAASASANDNKQIVLELDNMQVGGDRYIRGRAVTGNTTGGIATMLIFGVPFNSTEPHLASVVEVKSA
jgi:hypothetical protein